MAAEVLEAFTLFNKEFVFESLFTGENPSFEPKSCNDGSSFFGRVFSLGLASY